MSQKGAADNATYTYENYAEGSTKQFSQEADNLARLLEVANAGIKNIFQRAFHNQPNNYMYSYSRNLMTDVNVSLTVERKIY